VRARCWRPALGRTSRFFAARGVNNIALMVAAWRRRGGAKINGGAHLAYQRLG
jgi:hypothetical protein